MRVLVTGAAGFIGSNTAELLVSQGHEVVALDNLSSGRRENIPTGAEFVEGDCGDRDLVTALGPFEACVHFAAFIEPSESMKRPEAFFSNNVASTFRLLEALVDMDVARFVFSSSCAVYGNQTQMPIDEDRPVNPQSPYGLTKSMVEDGLRWMSQRGRINAASLRYFNAAGAGTLHPERHVPETHLIPLALETASGRREYLEIFGSDYETLDGTCVRDYVHVSDLAAAHVLAIDALSSTASLTLNLGTGVGSSNRQVVEAVRQVTGIDIDVRYTERREGDPAAAVADGRRAREVLGWQPSRSDLIAIVADAWAQVR